MWRRKKKTAMHSNQNKGVISQTKIKKLEFLNFELEKKRNKKEMESVKRIKVTDENLPQYYQRVGVITEDGKATVVATFDKGLGTMIFLKSQVEPFVPPKDDMMLPDLPALSFEEELEDMEPMVVSPRDYDSKGGIIKI
jgi:hypothetical protein